MCPRRRTNCPRQWFVNESLLQRCPQLLCVSSKGAGYDTIDVAACTQGRRRRGQPGRRQCGVGGGAYVRPDARRVAAHARMRPADAPRAGLQPRRRDGPGDPRQDHRAGRASGTSAPASRRWRVPSAWRCWRPTRCSRRRRSAGAAPRPCRWTICSARSDFVSLHCPRDASTLRMIDARAFGRMKQGRHLHHHRARRHPRRGRPGGGAAVRPSRRSRPGRVGPRAAAAGSSAAADGQRVRHFPHGRRDA